MPIADPHVVVELLPGHSGFDVVILPLKFMGLTGSPVRALALWNDDA
jgi:kynurenine formamidase